jgi:hypothetical protein
MHDSGVEMLCITQHIQWQQIHHFALWLSSVRLHTNMSYGRDPTTLYMHDMMISMRGTRLEAYARGSGIPGNQMITEYALHSLLA